MLTRQCCRVPSSDDYVLFVIMFMFWISVQDRLELDKSINNITSFERHLAAILSKLGFPRRPIGRQLSAMGKEGLYAEDRTDVGGHYTVYLISSLSLSCCRILCSFLRSFL